MRYGHMLGIVRLIYCPAGWNDYVRMIKRVVSKEDSYRTTAISI